MPIERAFKEVVVAGGNRNHIRSYLTYDGICLASWRHNAAPRPVNSRVPAARGCRLYVGTRALRIRSLTRGRCIEGGPLDVLKPSNPKAARGVSTPVLTSGSIRCRGLVVDLLVKDDHKADDLAVTHAEVVRQNYLVGQIGPVERAVVGSAHHGIAVMIEHLAHFDRHLVADHLLGHPTADGVDSDEFAVV